MGMFRMKEYLGGILVMSLFHMCKSGQFCPNLTWLILLSSGYMDVRRPVSIWRIMMRPHDLEMEDMIWRTSSEE